MLYMDYNTFLQATAERNRQICDEHYKDGKSQTQIAQKWGLSRQRVHVIIHNGKKNYVQED